MYYGLQIGCFLVAFSPPIALCTYIIGPRPILMTLAIIAAGFWILSALAIGVVWSLLGNGSTALNPLKASVVGTLLQETARAALVLSYRSFQARITSGKLFPLDDWTSSLACGIGFGAMHSLILYGSVLAASLNPDASLFVSSCSQVPLIFVSGRTSYYELRHICHAPNSNLCVCSSLP